MDWTSDAEQKLKEVPFFVRPAVRRRIEALAQEAQRLRFVAGDDPNPSVWLIVLPEMWPPLKRPSQRAILFAQEIEPPPPPPTLPKAALCRRALQLVSLQKSPVNSAEKSVSPSKC